MGNLRLDVSQNQNQSGITGFGTLLTLVRNSLLETDFPGTIMGALTGITALNVRTNVIPSYHSRVRGRFQSFAPGLRDGGEVSAGVNWLPGLNDTQGRGAADWSLLWQATLESNELTKIRIFAPDPDLHMVSIKGFLTQLGPLSYQPEAIMSGQVGWKLVGQPDLITPIVFRLSDYKFTSSASSTNLGTWTVRPDFDGTSDPTSDGAIFIYNGTNNTDYFYSNDTNIEGNTVFPSTYGSGTVLRVEKDSSNYYEYTITGDPTVYSINGTISFPSFTIAKTGTLSANDTVTITATGSEVSEITINYPAKSTDTGTLTLVTSGGNSDAGSAAAGILIGSGYESASELFSSTNPLVITLNNTASSENAKINIGNTGSSSTSRLRARLHVPAEYEVWTADMPLTNGTSEAMYSEGSFTVGTGGLDSESIGNWAFEDTAIDSTGLVYYDSTNSKLIVAATDSDSNDQSSVLTALDAGYLKVTKDSSNYNIYTGTGSGGSDTVESASYGTWSYIESSGTPGEAGAGELKFHPHSGVQGTVQYSTTDANGATVDSLPNVSAGTVLRVKKDSSNYIDITVSTFTLINPNQKDYNFTTVETVTGTISTNDSVTLHVMVSSGALTSTTATVTGSTEGASIGTWSYDGGTTVPAAGEANFYASGGVEYIRIHTTDADSNANAIAVTDFTAKDIIRFKTDSSNYVDYVVATSTTVSSGILISGAKTVTGTEPDDADITIHKIPRVSVVEFPSTEATTGTISDADSVTLHTHKVSGTDFNPQFTASTAVAVNSNGLILADPGAGMRLSNTDNSSPRYNVRAYLNGLITSDSVLRVKVDGDNYYDAGVNTIDSATTEYISMFIDGGDGGETHTGTVNANDTATLLPLSQTGTVYTNEVSFGDDQADRTAFIQRVTDLEYPDIYVALYGASEL